MTSLQQNTGNNVQQANSYYPAIKVTAKISQTEITFLDIYNSL